MRYNCIDHRKGMKQINVNLLFPTYWFELMKTLKMKNEPIFDHSKVILYQNNAWTHTLMLINAK